MRHHKIKTDTSIAERVLIGLALIPIAGIAVDGITIAACGGNAKPVTVAGPLTFTCKVTNSLGYDITATNVTSGPVGIIGFTYTDRVTWPGQPATVTTGRTTFFDGSYGKPVVIPANSSADLSDIDGLLNDAISPASINTCSVTSWADGNGHTHS